MKILITHIDLDGIGAAVLATAKNMADKIFYTDYDDVDRIIKSALTTPGLEQLYIVDISPQSEEVVAMLDQAADKVKLYDHHATAQEFIADKPWACIDLERCGTKLFAEEEGITAKYEDFIFLVNDYDLWKHEDPRSKDMHLLVWLLGRDKFVERFVKNPSTELTETEAVALNLYKTKRKQKVDAVIDKAIFVYDKLDRIVAVAISGVYKSQVAETIMNRYPQVDYVVVLDLDREQASLRSREIDVREIAEKFGGGGHKLAAGFQMPAATMVERFIRRPRRVVNVKAI